MLRLPDTDDTVAFRFKTAAKDVRLCEAKRHSSYNNRWSDHVVSLEGGKVRFRLQGDQALETPGGFDDDLGNIEMQPRLALGEGYETDPDFMLTR